MLVSIFQLMRGFNQSRGQPSGFLLELQVAYIHFCEPVGQYSCQFEPENGGGLEEVVHPVAVDDNKGALRHRLHGGGPADAEKDRKLAQVAALAFHDGDPLGVLQNLHFARHEDIHFATGVALAKQRVIGHDADLHLFQLAGFFI